MVDASVFTSIRHMKKLVKWKQKKLFVSATLAQILTEASPTKFSVLSDFTSTPRMWRLDNGEHGSEVETLLRICDVYRPNPHALKYCRRIPAVW